MDLQEYTLEHLEKREREQRLKRKQTDGTATFAKEARSRRPARNQIKRKRQNVRHKLRNWQAYDYDDLHADLYEDYHEN